MKCNHKDFEFISEEAYIDYTVIKYKCNDCMRTGFRNIERPTENNIDWEDSL